MPYRASPHPFQILPKWSENASSTRLHISSAQTGPITAESSLDSVPQESWRELMGHREMFVKVHLPHDCRCLVKFVEDAERMYAPLGFKNADDFIAKGLKLEPTEIRLAVDWLKINKPDEPIPIDVVQKAAQRAQEINAKTPDLKAPHRPKKGDNSQNDITLLERGTTAAYALARLRKDRPDIHARVLAGKISPHAGMIEAGFRKKSKRKSRVERTYDRIRKDWTKPERRDLYNRLKSEFSR
jgi:hypothetical protein